jgi:hypothetical protein
VSFLRAIAVSLRIDLRSLDTKGTFGLRSDRIRARGHLAADVERLGSIVGRTANDQRGRAAAAARGDRFFPAIGVDSTGHWFAIWQDTRRDPANHLISTFRGESVDGGQAWVTFDISTASFDPRKSFLHVRMLHRGLQPDGRVG